MEPAAAAAAAASAAVAASTTIETRPPVYFCHGCTARVSATRTPTLELECAQCGQTFVEEITESVVGDEALGEPPGAAGAEGGMGMSEGANFLRAFGIVGELPQGLRRSRSSRSTVFSTRPAYDDVNFLLGGRETPGGPDGNGSNSAGSGGGFGRSTTAAVATGAAPPAADPQAADANSLEQMLEQLLGGVAMPPTNMRGASGHYGSQGRGGLTSTGGAGRARGMGGGGGGGGTQHGNPLLGTLLEALRGGGSGRTEIFIGPNMQRVSAGTARGGDGMGGGGVGGLGSLGMLLRGIGVPGGFGGGMAGFGGPNVGNVGDYAFGDLSSLLQQLMAADPNRHGPPPASKEVVASLPTIHITQEAALIGQECAVCKDDFAVGETARELPCNHSFHEQCILPWVAERNTCPTCRHELPADDDSGGARSGSGGGGVSGGGVASTESAESGLSSELSSATSGATAASGAADNGDSTTASGRDRHRGSFFSTPSRRTRHRGSGVSDGGGRGEESGRGGGEGGSNAEGDASASLSSSSSDSSSFSSSRSLRR